MPNIICIDTATPVCSVVLVSGDTVVSQRISEEKNVHAAAVTVFIDEVLKEYGMSGKELDAVAVSKGPGSYTGLRIGVSAAKGFCYALDVPLLSVNTLKAMASGVMHYLPENLDDILLCPMIDARRMEVYCALFDNAVEQVRETKAEIVTENSFSEFLRENKIIFFGSGAEKCKEVLNHTNAVFIDDYRHSAAAMATVAIKKYNAGDFEDVAYFEPFYLKEFIAGIPQVKGLK